MKKYGIRKNPINLFSSQFGFDENQKPRSEDTWIFLGRTGKKRLVRSARNLVVELLCSSKLYKSMVFKHLWKFVPSFQPDGDESGIRTFYQHSSLLEV